MLGKTAGQKILLEEILKRVWANVNEFITTLEVPDVSFLRSEGTRESLY